MEGTVVSHYLVRARLGEGGMGEVWEAEDQRLGRRVALKLLPPRCADSESARARLLAEARAASALNHPGIAVVYDVGELTRDGVTSSFIAMEMVEGKTLREVLAERTLTVPEAIDVATQIAAALSEAHARGVVHRDIKPGNVMVTPSGRVKLLDFGLAKVAREEGVERGARELLESSGLLAGTAAYMSPEQARGQPVDARSDVFSLGVVLYEMLASRLPFRAPDVLGTLRAILSDEPDPVGADRASPELWRLVRRMLSKDLTGRPPTMRDVAQELAVVTEQLATTASHPIPVRPSLSRSLAVTSFANVTRIHEDDWLGTGLAETLAADMKSLPGVSVIGRERVHEAARRLAASTGGVIDESLATVLGREVGARWVVTGGYQRLGEQVRVTARVMEVDSGEVLRTVKVDGRMGEIFGLQDRLVKELLEGLSLTPAATDEADETHVVAAYEAYTRGMINLRAETRDSVDRALLFFERAVALDPLYARAHLRTGTALDLKGSYLGMPEVVEKALESVTRALELRPRWSEGWREMTSVLLSLSRFDEALSSARRAVELDPEDVGAQGGLARVLFLGHGLFAEAAAAYERALSLNPQAGWYQLQLAHACAYLRDFTRGEAAARAAIELQEGFLSGRDGVQIVGAYLRLGHLHALQGRHDAAIACFEREGTFIRAVNHLLRDRTSIELLARTGSAHLAAGRRETAREQLEKAVSSFEAWLALGADDASTRYYAACARALLGDLEGAFCDLGKAAAVRRAFTVARARLEPDLASLRADPRFAELVGEGVAREVA